MMKLTKIRLALLVAGLLMSSAVLAQAKYVWIDEKGVKQFADTPPPGNIPEKNIIKQPRRVSPAAAPPGDTSPASDSASSDAKPAPTTSDREADYKKRKAEQAEKDKKTADDAKKQQAQAENCARAKQNLDMLNSGGRVKTVDKDGQPTMMGDDERAQETQRAQQALNDCNKG